MRSSPVKPQRWLKVHRCVNRHCTENKCGFGKLAVAPAVDDSLHVQHGDYLEDNPRARILRRDVRAHKIVHEALHDPRRVCFAWVHPCCEKNELPLHHGNRVVHGSRRCNGNERNAVLPGHGRSQIIHLNIMDSHSAIGQSRVSQHTSFETGMRHVRTYSKEGLGVALRLQILQVVLRQRLMGKSVKHGKMSHHTNNFE